MVNWTFKQDQSPTTLVRALQEMKAGELLNAQRSFSAALARYSEAVLLCPEEPLFRWHLALCEFSAGLDDLAGQHLEQLVRQNPEFAPGYTSLAEWYLMHNIIDPALELTAKAVAMDPNNLAILSTRARTLMDAGFIDEALDMVETLVVSGRINVPIARMYAALSKRHGKTNESLNLIQDLLTMGTYLPQDEASLRFANTQLLEKLTRYDEAFAEAARANSLLPNTFDLVSFGQYVERQIAFFTKEKMRALAKSSNRTEKSVLLVGMPRSGTSLIEQILASHPDVHGAGELDLLYWTYTGLLKMLQADEEHYPACLDQMTIDQADGMHHVYIDPLGGLNPSASRIIDKMPLNYLHLGLVNLLLPGAKIIHCRRNALDTCLSCFMTDFAAGKEFTRDLTKLGGFYCLYERIMAHWKEVLDLEILDINYEEMVAEPQAQTRRALEFLGLPWDERCLNFHKTKRPVATASSVQVRQPIYLSSRQRWQRYEKHLGPLLAALNHGGNGVAPRSNHLPTYSS